MEQAVAKNKSDTPYTMEVEYVVSLVAFLIGIATWIIDIFTYEYGVLFNVITIVAMLASAGMLIYALDKYEKFIDYAKTSHKVYIVGICVIGFIIGANVSRLIGWA